MLPLKELRGYSSSNRNGMKIFEETKNINNNSNNDTLEVFIPHLPEEIERENLV